MENKEQYQILYQEFIRLCKNCDDHIKASFSDFKFFGGLALIAGAWQPVAKEFKMGIEILFCGFLIFLFVASILFFRDLARHTFIGYHIIKLRGLEAALQKSLDLPDENAFSYFEELYDWLKKTTSQATYVLNGVFAAFVILFPTTILFFYLDQEVIWCWPAYLLASLLVCLLAARSQSIYMGELGKRLAR